MDDHGRSDGLFKQPGPTGWFVLSHLSYLLSYWSLKWCNQLPFISLGEWASIRSESHLVLVTWTLTDDLLLTDVWRVASVWVIWLEMMWLMCHIASCLHEIILKLRHGLSSKSRKNTAYSLPSNIPAPWVFRLALAAMPKDSPVNGDVWVDSWSAFFGDAMKSSPKKGWTRS